MTLLREARRCVAASSARFNAFVSHADRLSPTATAAVVNDGLLRGRLIAIKDNICTTDLATTAASGVLRAFRSPYDATVVAQLRAEGASLAGKTNMDEFGMGSHSTHSFFGAVNQGERSAGGSSGGSAVAVASGQCWAALGTDTGGSVRLPAAYTGTVGFKPSYGLVSRWGVIAYANSLDTVGILARQVSAVRTVFAALNHYDPKDPTSLTPDSRARLSSHDITHPLRVGVPLDYNITSLHPAVRSAWLRALRHLQTAHSAALVPVRLPSTRHALSAYYILAPSEASSNLAKYDSVRYGTRPSGPDGTSHSVLFAKTRAQGLGGEVKRRILLGAFSLSANSIQNYFIQAQKIRRLVQRDFDAVFAAPNPLLEQSTKTGSTLPQVDVIVCPTAPTPPPMLDELKDQSPLDAYMNDVFTVPASLAGLPAVNIPAAAGRGIDGVGIQILGQYGCDQLVLDVAERMHEVKY